MQIRTRLSIYFTAISAILLFIVLVALYFLFTNHVDQDFLKALKERAIVTAQVYLEADEISDSSLQHFKREYLNALPQEVIRMYDSLNHPAFIPDKDHHWDSSIINDVRVKENIQYHNRNNDVVGIRYDDNQGSFVILVSAYDKVGHELKRNLFKLILILYVLQIIVLFIAGRWFAKKAILPIKTINQQVQKITASDLHIRLNEGNEKDEISELASNFNNLLHRLQTAFDIQKTFIANTSHELRTPITSIIGEIEVVKSRERNKDEYLETLESVLNETEKLNKIIEAFLGLANAEQLFYKKSEPIRLDELLWEIKNATLSEHESKLVSIQIASLPPNESDLIIQANKHLVEIAITNIIKNALKFSNNNKPVTCILNAGSSSISIKIIDQGIGINNEEISKIFEPFYRGKNSVSFEGYGVGLFLAKKIINLYDGTITVETNAEHGTCFNIVFTKTKSFEH